MNPRRIHLKAHAGRGLKTGMKKNAIGWLIVSVFLGIVLLSAGTYVSSVFRSVQKAKAARAVILRTDRAVLLSACREMIANRENYRNDWPSSWGLDKDDRAMQRDMGGYGTNVPGVIRDMEPLHIAVGRHRVLVYVHGPPRTGFIGYTEGNDELDMLQRTHTTMLTNGLWMFTH